MTDRRAARARERARARARSRAKPRLRDRFFQRGVARAITSPTGMIAGSLVGGGFVAGGAHPVWCLLAGLVGWGVPVVRAMQKVPGLAGRPTETNASGTAKPDEWERQILDAEDAVDRFLAAVERCRSGPLLDRLRELEEDVLQSLGTVHELAVAGRETTRARRELNPSAMTKAARRAGAVADAAASSHRELIAELLAVEDETRTRLTVINGRLDEAVGRATEILARSIADDGLARDDDHATGGVAGEVAAELGRLSAALHEVDAHTHPHPPEVRAAATATSGSATATSPKPRRRGR